MTHADIDKLQGKKYTYANIVMDHRPQKEDPNRIRITAGGNLIQYDKELSVRTADVSTAKLHWNSVISTPGARYMCLDLSLFYLSAALEYYEYMKIPLALFPVWIVEQYGLLQYMQGMEWCTSKCDGQCGGYRKQGFWQIRNSNESLHHMDTMSMPTPQDYGITTHDQFPSLWWLMILVLNT